MTALSVSSPLVEMRLSHHWSDRKGQIPRAGDVLWHSDMKYGKIWAHECPRAAANSRGREQPVKEVAVSSIPRTSGIYQILCVPTGKVYIGSAVNLANRVGLHIRQLNAQDHHSPYLQRAWDKYGEAAFTFTVLAFVPRDQLIATEQYYLDLLEACDPTTGYNTCTTAGSRAGILHSPATRQKMSDDRKGRKRGPMSQAQKDKISEARRGKDLSHRLGKRHTEESREKMRQAKLGRPEHPNAARAKVEARSKDYIVTDPDGNEYRIKNLSAFCRDHGLSRECMYATQVGKIRSHKGWTCREVEI